MRSNFLFTVLLFLGLLGLIAMFYTSAGYYFTRIIFKMF